MLQGSNLNLHGIAGDNVVGSTFDDHVHESGYSYGLDPVSVSGISEQ